MDDWKKRYKIARAKPGKGFGLFALVPIRKGEFILEYTGTRITTAVADKLPTRYLFEIDEDWTIDGSPRSNTARYINHSCDPNCEADIVDGKILITAAKNILAGEELTFDYGEEYFDEFIKPFGCMCQSCRRKSEMKASTK